MAKQISHADLQIRILELENEGYPVEITFFGEQEFPRGYLDPGELPWVAGSSPIEDGERLFEWLFADDQLKTVWAEVRGQRPQRRIRLRIDAEAPELHAIPWELLRDNSSSTAQDISAATTTPFSRYLAGQWQPGGPILQRPIKILLAIANPENIADFDLASLEVDKEIELIEAATKDLDVELTTLDQPVTLAAIETAIEDGHHIIHFVGHGTFSERRNHAQIFLADNDNQVALVKDSEFAEMIANHLSDEERPSDDKLRMVFLASCQTATRSSADPFRGFAPALVQVGLPAVVAMQDLVPIETAQAFSTTFYQRLIDHGTVDLASNEARSALITADLPGSAIPVLFMRLQSGLLFAERGQILGDRADSFWNTLLDNIADGECTPFLGPGVTTNMLPSKDEMARTLARDYSYPFPDRSNLPKVAQFVGTLDNRRLRRDVLNINIGRFKEVMQLKRDRKDRRATLSETIDKSDW
ncbi:MAG: CHAT domain-containing protein, partial [Chloroflexota bacterium]